MSVGEFWGILEGLCGLERIWRVLGEMGKSFDGSWGHFHGTEWLGGEGWDGWNLWGGLRGLGGGFRLVMTPQVPRAATRPCLQSAVGGQGLHVGVCLPGAVGVRGDPQGPCVTPCPCVTCFFLPQGS